MKTRALTNTIGPKLVTPSNGKVNFKTDKGMPANGRIRTKHSMKASEFR
jgi:hypothetical protein